MSVPRFDRRASLTSLRAIRCCLSQQRPQARFRFERGGTTAPFAPREVVSVLAILSQRSRYALGALGDLAQRYGALPVPAGDIARRNGYRANSSTWFCST